MLDEPGVDLNSPSLDLINGAVCFDLKQSLFFYKAPPAKPDSSTQRKVLICSGNEIHLAVLQLLLLVAWRNPP